MILLSLSAIGLIIGYHQTYPLSITPSSGYVAHIPLFFWMSLVVAFFSITLFVAVVRDAVASLVFTIIFYFVFNAYRFLFYGVMGGDMSGELNGLHQMSKYNHLYPEIAPHFSYLQWPNYFFHNFQMNAVFGTSIMETAQIGYVAYLLIFSIGVWLFVYAELGKPFLAFSGATAFMIMVNPWLTNQFVPQFLALIILVFLVLLRDRLGPRWILIKGFLFLALVLSHPSFFFFYLFAVTIRPLISRLICGLETVNNGRQVYQALANSIRHPVAVIQGAVTTRSMSDQGNWLLVLGITYLVFFFHRFNRFQQRFLLVGAQPPQSSPAGSVSTINVITKGTEGTGKLAGDISRRYALVDAQLEVLATQSSKLFLITLGFFVLIGFLLRDLHDISAHDIALLIGGIAYFVLGFALNILGSRAFQVIFLPLVLGVGGLQDRERLAHLATFAFAILSIILIINMLFNLSLVVGLGTDNLYANKAGETLTNYNPGLIVKPPYSTHPIRGPNTVDLRFALGKYSDDTRSGVVISVPRTHHYLPYRGVECKFQSGIQHVIYDNRAKVIWDKNINSLMSCSTA